MHKKVNKYKIGGIFEKLGLADKNDNGELSWNKQALGTIAAGAGLLANGLISGNYSSGAGDFLGGAALLASAIPGYGQFISAGLNAVGGITNRLFGSQWNEQTKAQAENELAMANKFTSNASDWEGLASEASRGMIGNYTASDFGKDGPFGHAVANYAKLFQADATDAMNHVLNELINNSMNIKDTSLLNMDRRNITAFGGELHTNGANYTNGLISINKGGTHELNPYGGVLMGVDPEGVPNLVEEGEVVVDGFVFTNRDKPSKQLAKKYKINDLTFADAVKKLGKESEERPNDSISKSGKNAWIQDLTIDQETRKAKREQREYAKGGRLNIYAPGGWEYFGDLQATKGFDPAKYKAGTFDQYKASFGVPDWVTYDVYNKAMQDFGNWFKNQSVDKLNELIDTWWNHTPAEFKNSHSDPSLRRALFEQYNGFGNRDPYTNTSTNWGVAQAFRPIGGWENYMHAANPNYGSDRTNLIMGYQNEIVDDGFGNPVAISKPIFDRTLTEKPYSPPEKKDPKDQELTPRLDTRLRWAPVVGSALGAMSSWLSNPDYKSADYIQGLANKVLTPNPISYSHLGERLAYNPLDEDYIANSMKSSFGATNRHLMNTSGGNRNTANAGLLAAGLNASNVIGEALRQAAIANSALKKDVTNFALDRDAKNAAMGIDVGKFNSALDWDAKKNYLSAASDAEKMRYAERLNDDNGFSANLTTFFDNLGAIGNENFIINQINSNPALAYALSRDGAGFYKGKGHKDGGYLTIHPKRKR